MALNFGLLDTSLPAQIGAIPGNALAMRRQRIQQDEDRAFAREGAQMQNALARMQMQKAQRDMAEDDSVRNVLSQAQAGDWNTVLPDLRKVAPDKAMALEAQLSKMQGQRADMRAKMSDLGYKKLGAYREALIYVNTPEQFAQWLTAQHSDPDLQEIMGVLPPLDQSLATIPQDPREFEAMKVKSALGLGKFMEMNKPSIEAIDLGGTKQFFQKTPFTGEVRPVGGPIGKTLSPSDAVAQQGNQAMRDLLLQERQMRVDEGRAKQDDRMRQRKAEEASIASQIGVIDKALSHPGRATATGLSSVTDPRNFVPGTNASDFRAVLDQIGGAAFLQAFESLKGGGQITEVEGKKATDAIARLSRSQSDKEFEQSLRDLRDVMSRGYERLTGSRYGAAAPQSQGSQQAGMQRINSDDEYNALPSGAVFVGPDGKQRRKP